MFKKTIFMQKGLIGIAILILLVLIVSPRLILPGVRIKNLKIGDIVSRDIAAPQIIEFEDKEATARKEKEVLEKQLKPVYLLNLNILEEVKGKVGESVAFNTFKGIMERGIVKDKVLLSKRAKEGKIYVKGKGEISIKGIYSVAEATQKLKKRLKDKSYEIISAYLQPNLEFSETETDKYKKQIMKNVNPVLIRIEKGEMILRYGTKVTSHHLEKLNALASSQRRANMVNVSGLVVLLLSFIFLTGTYLKKYHWEIFRSNKNLLLLGLIIVATIGIAEIIIMLEKIWPYVFSGYLIPFAAASMIIAILFKGELAIFVTLFLSIFVGVIMGNNIEFSILTFLGGIVGIYCVSKVKHRTDLIKAGLYIGGMNIVLIFALGLMNNSAFIEMMRNSLQGVGNGFFSAFLTIGGLPFIEHVFKVTTDFKLLELSTLNSPLMKRLLSEAPGTYQHSIIVSNLAESTAESIGANPLLGRVGGYYHDIGKIKNPNYFIENQNVPDNIHKNITSNISNLILNSHVKDGVELALQYKLPPVVIDIIKQHHGTSSKRYFYYQSIEREKEQTKEDDFRYMGPRPQSKEAAIIMLADAAESGTRALAKPTSARIKEKVHTIIDNCFTDGQLDECNLTLKDLNRIANSFVYLLTSIYHSRVEYPEKDARKKEGAGESNNK